MPVYLDTSALLKRYLPSATATPSNRISAMSSRQKSAGSHW